MIIKGIQVLHQSCESSLHLGFLLHAFMSSADFFFSFIFLQKNPSEIPSVSNSLQRLTADGTRRQIVKTLGKIKL